MTFEEEQLGDDVFNQAQLRDPGGLSVNAAGSAHVLAAAARRADRIGLRLFQRVRHSGARHRRRARVLGVARFRRARRGSAAVSAHAADQRRLDLALYRTRALRQPVLTFEDATWRERLARLRERGVTSVRRNAGQLSTKPATAC